MLKASPSSFPRAPARRAPQRAVAVSLQKRRSARQVQTLLSLSALTILAAGPAVAAVLGFGDRPLEASAFAGALLVVIGCGLFLRQRG